MSRALWIVTLVLVCASALLFFGRAVAPDLAVYHVVDDYALRWLSSTINVPLLVAGAIFARRAARGFGAGNPAARAWWLLMAWLALLAAGQLVFSVYGLVLRVPTPLPSAGDVFYLCGYAAMISGIVSFQRAYAGSGMAVGTTPARAVLAVALGVALLEAALLAPLSDAEGPWIHRALNAAYPVLDGVSLVLLFVLGRTVRSLRGGRVWRVWMTLLVAMALTCAGDIAFAYFFFHQVGRIESIVNLAFMASYAMAARGAYLQAELVAPGPAPFPR